MTQRSDILLPQIKSSHLIQRLYTTPLVSNFGGMVPVSAPLAKIFFLSRKYESRFDGAPLSGNIVEKNFGEAPEDTKASSVKFEILSKNIEVKTEKIKTSWTQEALQDYSALFVEKDEDEVGKTLASEILNESIIQIDQNVISYAINEAKKESYTIPGNSTSIQRAFDYVELIFNGSLDMVAKLHNKNVVTVLASREVIKSLMAHPNFIHGESFYGKDLKENFYFVGRIGNINIFLDYYGFLNSSKSDQNNGALLIGVKDLFNEANSSLVFSPFQTNIVDEIDPESGTSSVFVFNSYGYTLCPQHDKVNSPMIKFLEIKQ